jgi:hypothetical protein
MSKLMRLYDRLRLVYACASFVREAGTPFRTRELRLLPFFRICGNLRNLWSPRERGTVEEEEEESWPRA